MPEEQTTERSPSRFRFGIGTALTSLTLFGGIFRIFDGAFRSYAETHSIPLILGSFICTCWILSLLATVVSLVSLVFDRRLQYLIELGICFSVLTLLVMKTTWWRIETLNMSIELDFSCATLQKSPSCSALSGRV